MAASNSIHPRTDIKQEPIKTEPMLPDSHSFVDTGTDLAAGTLSMAEQEENKENVNKDLPEQNDGETANSDAADDSPVIDIVISNVVCTFNLRCHINLKRLAMEGANVEYRREHGVSGIGTVLIKLNSPAGRPVFQAVLHTPSIAFWCPSSKLCGNRLCHWRGTQYSFYIWASVFRNHSYIILSLMLLMFSIQFAKRLSIMTVQAT